MSLVAFHGALRWVPVILFPTLADACKVFVRDIDVNNLDARSVVLWPERKGENGVDGFRGPVSRSPCLNNESLRLDVE